MHGISQVGTIIGKLIKHPLNKCINLAMLLYLGTGEKTIYKANEFFAFKRQVLLASGQC